MGFIALTPEILFHSARVAYKLSGDQSVSSTATVLNFNTVVGTPIGNWVNSSGTITVPVDGNYSISAGVRTTTGGTFNNTAVLRLMINGNLTEVGGTSPSGSRTASLSKELDLKAGDEISITAMRGDFGGSVTFTAEDGIGSGITIKRNGDYSHQVPVGTAVAKDGNPGLIEFYRSEVISLSGDYSGTPTARITRVGNQVVLDTIDVLAHSNASSASSAAGVIPAWARPSVSDKRNAYSFSTSTVRLVTVSTAGTLTTNYRTWSGSADSNTNSGTNVSICYNVG